MHRSTVREDIRISANLHHDRGYFSLTGKFVSGGYEVSGMVHDELLAEWPDLVLAARLHLSKADTGMPMHAVANGLYWLRGCQPEIQHPAVYHGGNGRGAHSPEDCKRILMEHLRCTEAQADSLIANMPRNEAEMDKAITAMGLPEQWAREAAELREFIAAN